MQSLTLPYEQNFLGNLRGWLTRKYHAVIFDWALSQVKFCPVDEVINLGNGDAEKIRGLCPQGSVTNFDNSSATMPFADKTFNVATVFGTANSFREIYRVLNIGGVLMIVDDFDAGIAGKVEAAGFEIFKTATKNFIGGRKICIVAEK